MATQNDRQRVMKDQSLLTWCSACQTHAGKVRKVNQDACLELPELGLWAVADGIGGHEAGDVASRMIVEYLQQVEGPVDLKSFIHSVKNQLFTVNRHLRKMAVKRYANSIIGSTVAALLAFADQCAYLWVGDSRIYRLRSGRLVQLTRDHSWVEESIEQGLLRPDEASTSRSANVLTRAVGVHDELDVEVRIDQLQHGDTFLLCSDGLYKEVTETEIAGGLAESDPATIARDLVDLALDGDASDNVSVAVVRLTEALF